MVFSLVTVFDCLAPDAAHGDTGWTRVYDLAEGAVYSVTENPEIALDKEILHLTDPCNGTVVVHFQFRNTTDREVRVDAAFPVEYAFRASEGRVRKGRIRLFYEDDDKPARGTSVWVLGEDHGEAVVDRGLLKLAGISVHDGTFAREDDGDEHEPAYVLASDLRPRRIERPVPSPAPFAFSMEQDGAPVVQTSLAVDLRPSSPQVTFHLRHQLVFAPRATSTVRVTYQPRQVVTVDRGLDVWSQYDCEWTYVLHTGATWKGPIGKLLLVVPPGGKLEPFEDEKEGRRSWGAAKGYTRLGSHAAGEVWVREAFEPTRKDDLRVTYSGHPILKDHPVAYSEEDETSWESARRPRVGVTLLEATPSSTTRPRATVAGVGFVHPPATADVALDGLPETLWCAAEPRDATPASMVVRIGESAAGLRVMNASDESCGRLGRLDIQALPDGPRWSFPVADQGKRWQLLGALLPPGDYRLVFAQVHRGSKTAAPCVGEIDFVTGPIAWLEPLVRDPFFGPHFADRGRTSTPSPPR